MTSREFTDLNHNWEKERKRRLAWKRREMLARNVDLIVNAILIALSLIAGAILVYLHVTQEKRERVAYLEGRHDVSHAVAVAMYEEERNHASTSTFNFDSTLAEVR